METSCIGNINEPLEIISLKKFCEVRTGISLLREGKEDDLKCYLIQLKDVNDDGFIEDDLKVIYIEKLPENQIIKKNEILFKAKSSNNMAAIMEKEGLYITTSHYLILKVKNEKIDVNYLWWYLNQRIAQKHFKRLASGGMMPIVKKSDLENLKVIVPPLEKQKQIVEAYRLWLREKELLKEKIQLKDRYIKEFLINSIEK